jgi:hypothetical protein
VDLPDPFNFRIVDRNSGEDLVFSEHPRYLPDSIRLYYHEDEEEIDLPLRILSRDFYQSVFSNQTLP